MAGGNSPRQRMINLMYLVFIAMLALNMGKEALSAFGFMNQKLEIASERSTRNNEEVLQSLKVKADEKPDDYKGAYDNALKVNELSNEYYNYLQGVKNDILGQFEEKGNYEIMDQSDYLDEKFFKADGVKEEGKLFFKKYLDYRNQILELLGENNESLRKTIEKRFDVGDEDFNMTTSDDRKMHWMNYYFERFPVIASVMKMSQIQVDIRQTEQDYYTLMLGEKMRGEVSMSHYTTLLEQSKGAYYQNQVFDGAIVLGRKDSSTRPSRIDLSLDGKKLSKTEYEIKDGKIQLKVNTGSVGEHKITGTLYYDQDGKEVPVAVSQTFTTIPRPNEAVISADKMNVVYRGVVNPITISMPGVSDNNVTATAPGLRKKSGSTYEMRPETGNEVNVVVTGTIDGQKFTSSKKFRIKDLPKPQGAILGTTGMVELPKTNIANGEISVIYEGFDFELSARVTSFRILVPGQPSVVVNGNKISQNPTAQAAVNRAQRGDIIYISDIRYSVSGYNGRTVPAMPISIEVK